jgi:casein kinase 1 delta/casein kinase I family protein HRR25
MLIYFARGSLPWQGFKVPTDKERNKLIQEKKMSLSGQDLCGEVLPSEFATYINYTRSLSFDDRPDYLYLRKLFRRLFRSEGFKYDNVFDWTEKRFNEIHVEVRQPTPPSPRPTTLRRVRPQGNRRRTLRGVSKKSLEG